MFDRLLSRRDMLRTGVAVGVSATIPSLATARDENPFGGFTVAIQSYTFRKFNLEQACKRMSASGVHFGEFFRNHIPTDAKPEGIKTALKVCGDHGIKPVAFGVEAFTKDHAANKARFDFAAALGIKYLSADPTPDSFDSLDKLCAEYKIAIAIHPHGPSGKGRHRWWSAETIMAAVKDHHELIGTCLDTGHLIRMAQLGEKLDPAQQVKVMGARNFGMHLKDHDNKRQTDTLYGKDGGVLDVGSVLKSLKDVKFGGYIAIEYEAKPEEPTEDVKALVGQIKEAIAKLK